MFISDSQGSEGFNKELSLSLAFGVHSAGGWSWLEHAQEELFQKHSPIADYCELPIAANLIEDFAHRIQYMQYQGHISMYPKS